MGTAGTIEVCLRGERCVLARRGFDRELLIELIRTLGEYRVIGLPSLAALDRAASTRIWLATQPADMRCGFDRLAELAQVVTNQNPMDGHLFLFRGRNGDRLKLLLLGSGWLCPVVQAAGGRRLQNAANRR